MKPAQAASTSMAAAAELQAVLHQTGGRGKGHVRREGGQDDQVDVLRIDAGVVDAADGGFVAQIAGGLVRQGVAAFEDAGALDDPVGIEAEAVEQVVVGDDGVRHVAAGSQNRAPPSDCGSEDEEEGCVLRS